MIRELDNVVLDVDLPQHGLRRGDIGTAVLAHGDKGFEVEFVTLDGETVAVVSLTRDQIRSVQPGELAHARPVDAA